MSKYINLIGLLLYGVIILLPPIIYGYSYPNVGDDTAVYLNTFEGMKQNGGLINGSYLAYTVVGYPIIFFSDLLGISMDTVFLWFSFISLILVGVVIFIVVSKLVNAKTGWLALVVTIFCAQGIMFLFYYGQIFNMINIGIILPILLYFTARYLQDKRGFHFVMLLVFAGLFAAFHVSGVYLPIMAGFITVVYLIYGRAKKVKLDRTVIKLGAGITSVGIAIFCVFVLLPTIIALAKVSNLGDYDFIASIGKGMSVPMIPYLMNILSPGLLILAVFVLLSYKDIIRTINAEVKRVLLILACIVVVLAISAFAKLSLDPWRQAVDLATMLSLLIVIPLGVLISRKNMAIIAIVLLIAGVGMFHNLTTWFGYNSALRQVDLQAIEYMNNSSAKTYSVSSQVAFWVYDRYTDMAHQDNDGDVVIVRSEPMTPRSTEDNIWYQKHGWKPSLNYSLVRTFTDGKVEIQVYAKKPPSDENVRMAFFNMAGENTPYVIGIATTRQSDFSGFEIYEYSHAITPVGGELGVKDPAPIIINGEICVYFDVLGDSTTSIWLAKSNDGGLTFSRYGDSPLLSKDGNGWESGGVGYCTVYDTGIVGGKRYAMLYSGYGAEWDGIGYAYSEDGLSWTRGEGNPVIPVGKGGDWDGYSVVQPSNVVKVGTKYYVMYTGKSEKLGDWKIGLVSFSDFGGDYKKHESNPIVSGESDKIADVIESVVGGAKRIAVSNAKIFSQYQPVWLSDGVNDEFNRVVGIAGDNGLELEKGVSRVYPIGSTIRSWAYGSVSPSYLSYNPDSGKWIQLVTVHLPYENGIVRESTGWMWSGDGINWHFDYAKSPPLPLGENGIISAENIKVLEQ